MSDKEVFDFFRHYGAIQKRDDYISDDIFVSLFVIELDNVKRLFILKNGEIILNEILKGL